MTKEYPSHRRSKLEIYTEVLQIIKEGAQKPTKIMYSANLSWQPLLRILQSMIRQGLIEKLDAKKVAKSWGLRPDKRTSTLYAITQKGENVLMYFSKGKDLIDVR